MIEKIETNVDRLLSVSKLNKNFGYIAEIELFFNFEIKSSLSTSIFILSIVSQILKRIFHVLKTQTCRNLKSFKFANLLSNTHVLNPLSFKWFLFYSSISFLTVKI